MLLKCRDLKGLRIFSIDVVKNLKGMLCVLQRIIEGDVYKK